MSKVLENFSITVASFMIHFKEFFCMVIIENVFDFKQNKWILF